MKSPRNTLERTLSPPPAQVENSALLKKIENISADVTKNNEEIQLKQTKIQDKIK